MAFALTEQIEKHLTNDEIIRLTTVTVSDQVTAHFNCTPAGGDVVVLSGRAELVPGSPPPTEVPGMLAKYRARIDQLGYTLEWFAGYSLAIRVTPERAWAIG